MGTDVKVSWYVTIDDHAGFSLYAEDILARTVRNFGDRVTSVERVITRWSGSHDDDTRKFEYIDRTDVTRMVRGM